MDAVFTRPTAPCPQCSIPLRRSLFRVQQFEDAAVEKEVDIRKRILKELVHMNFKCMSLYDIPHMCLCIKLT